MYGNSTARSGNIAITGMLESITSRWEWGAMGRAIAPSARLARGRLVTFGAIAAASLLNDAITTATEALESESSDAASGGSGSESGDTELADVERYQWGDEHAYGWIDQVTCLDAG
jgi:hypothetical protein